MATTTTVSLEAEAAVPGNPPRENLVRAVFPGSEVTNQDGKRTLHGHFSVFNEWTEINSAWEGRFMERIAPGAFAKTISENRAGIKVLFDHGHDPSIGNKPLGPIRSLEEDDRGASYEVELLDTSYVRDLIPALEEGLLGASFRFKVMREDFDKAPSRSDINPEGIPERTITEVRLHEFGPVTFPAYDGATAGVRSLTDDFILKTIFGDPERIARLLEEHPHLIGASRAITPPTEPTPPSQGTSSEVRREAPRKFNSTKEWQAWITSI